VGQLPIAKWEQALAREHLYPRLKTDGNALNEESRVFREVNGFWGLIVLVADIWAIINIVQSSASTGRKVLWTVLVILLPVLGFILWFFMGPKTGRVVK
jgi:hypothetical protein